MIGEKKCNRCGLTKSVDEFHIRSSAKDGLTYYCKECRRKIRNYKIKYRKREEIEFLPKEKQCSVCKKILLQFEFNFDNQNADGLGNCCKKCARAKQLKSSYNITIDDYNKTLEKQNEVCAICHQPETVKRQDGEMRSLSVDHDHQTGKTRGLLCNNCNRLLSDTKDDINILKSAINYLEKHNVKIN